MNENGNNGKSLEIDWEKIYDTINNMARFKIKNRKGISLLEFALEGLEKYHASLGR